MDERAEPPALDDFDDFYRREYRSVLGLAYVLTGRRAVAEELTQEAFLHTLRAWQRVGAMDRPDAWVRRVVANRSASRLRRLGAEAKALQRIRQEQRRWVDEPELTASVWRAVRRLPRRQAQAIALHYLHDLSRREVASILGCSEETVKTHLDRARATLAARLRTEEEKA